MEDHLTTGERSEGARKATPRDYVLGAAVAVLIAAATVVAAILTFDVNPAAPVVVTVAAIAGGSLLVPRVHDAPLKAVAVGLVVGGVAAILLWPFFDVS
jgi:hypothetical protein